MRFIPGQILVKPRAQLSESDLDARLKAHTATRVQTLRHSNVQLLRVSEERAEAVLAALRSDPAIEFAERDGLARAAFLPNDPYFVSGAEWHLARIQAPQAWNLTMGVTNTIVAILDSGINAAHPDLVGKVLPGYDFVWGDNDPSDDFGHGTAVAGVVVAAGNNSAGVAGVAYGCKVLPVKVMDASGFASYSCLAQGIRYAVDQGARVLNISIAGQWPSQTLQDAINYAWSNNVVVVAAAGNNGDSTPQYPAAFEHVVAVSATEPDDSLASFSSYGSYITLSAPGDNIWTTQRDPANPYGSWRGTSFASPVVAAVAALTISAAPSLSTSQVVSLLEQNADSADPTGYNTSFGYGRVNAFRTVSAANPALADNVVAPLSPPMVTLTSPADDSAFAFGTTVSLAASASASTGSVASVQFLVDGLPLSTCLGDPFACNWTPVQPGTYSLTAVAADGLGLCSTSAPVTIYVSQTDTTIPRIRLTSAPANGARLLTPAVSLAGVAADNAGLQRIEVQVNDSPAQPADGTATWQAQVTLVPGPNVVRVRAVDAAGNVSPDITRTFSYVVTSVLTIQTNGWGRVSPNLDGRLLEVGRTYTVRAAPGPGQLFAGWEGLLAQSAVLTFVMQTNLTLVADFAPTPFPVAKGAYAGLLANTNAVAPDNSGYFRLAVTSMGRFSARLYSGGRSYGFSGQFDLNGNATVAIRRGALSPLTITFHVDLVNGTDQVTGSVTDGAWAAQLEGDRNVFNARHNPAEQAGVHSFVLEPAQDTATTAASGASRIAKSGAALVRGKLNDGRAFGLGSMLAKSGDCPLYLSFNRGKEVVIGWLNFPSGPGPLASGTVVWVKSGTNAFATTLKATSN